MKKLFLRLFSITLLLGLFMPLARVEADTFTATGSMITAHQQMTATLLPNGLVLIAGGYGSTSHTSAELYNPATGIFTATGSMTTGRKDHTATLLPNGLVLIAGGDSGSGTAELYNPATGTFTATGSMTTARSNHIATLLPNGLVLIAGGTGSNIIISSAELYNPATGTFTATGSMTTAREYHTATLLPNGLVLIAGGQNGSGTLSSAELYNFATGTFTAIGSMTTAREYHTATLLPNGLVLISGGIDNNGNSLSSAELFNYATGTFTATGSMTTARKLFTATLLPNGLVLMAGGHSDGTVFLSSAELYNPATGTFTATAGSMTAARDDHTATLLPNGQVLIAGGYYNGDLSSTELYSYASGTFTATGSMTTAHQQMPATLLPNGQVLIAGGYGSTSHTSAELYNPATGIFTATGSMTTARKMGHTATLMPTGLVLIAGGTGSSIINSSAELYNLATGTFTTTGSMTTVRSNHTATLLPNGLVLIAGGDSGSGTAELYNPATGTFTATGSLTTAREYHTATLLPNGMVLIAGGQNGSGTLSNAELYNPATGTFTATGSMTMAREYHTATLLPNGMVLIAGGQNSSVLNIALSSAELYNPATGTFTATGSMTTARKLFTATLLPNSQVLIAGGGNVNILSSAELYNFATGTFTATGSMTAARDDHTATLLPNGQVLIAGGYYNSDLSSTELYNYGLGYIDSSRPVVSNISFSGTELAITGSGFLGNSEGSSGNTPSSATNYPVVQLQRIDNDQISFLLSDPTTNWSNTSFTSQSLSGLAAGYYRATVFTNGIPSMEAVISWIPVTAPGAPTITQVSTGNGTATVTFTAPANNGGSTITGYTVTATPTSGFPITATGTGTSIVVTGLTNGTAYTFTVTASNTAGTSVASTASDTAIPGSTPRIQLPQTGQTGCWDSNGNAISCFGTGQDGAIQSGVVWPDSRFTNTDGTTPVNTTVILDNVTGLQWAQNAGTPTYGSCNGGLLAWQDALTYVACLNANSYLGHTDWRLPNVNELATLPNHQQTDSSVWLNSQGFANVQQTYYWTSTTKLVSSTSAVNAWYVNMYDRYVDNSPKTNQYLVWPVRTGTFTNVPRTGQTTCWDANGNQLSSCSGTGQDGEKQAGVSWPNPRFTNLDLSTPVSGSTVYDRLTGLQWVQDGSTPSFSACSGGQLVWQSALDYVTCLNNNIYLGYSDWRLPDHNELMSLVTRQQNPSTWLNSEGFINISDLYWSSDTYVLTSANAWEVSEGVGYIWRNAKTATKSVLPVRGGYVVPGSPTITSVTTGNESATISFTAPAANGSGSITGYTVTAKNGSTIVTTVSGTGSPITVTGLTNGTTYKFIVAATNATGTGKSATATALVSSQTIVNGHCGSANGETFTQTPTANLCSSTTTPPTVIGTGPQTWSCTGSVGGGTTANCKSYFTTNVAAPITSIAPAGGSYATGNVGVTLTCSNSAATIYYTTDGSSPTVLSPVYSTPITVTGNETINYFSVDPVGNAEPVRTATYAVTSAGAPPTVNVALVKSGTSYTVFSSIGGATPTPVITNSNSATFTDPTPPPPNTIVTYTVTSDTDPSLTTLMTIHTPMYNGWNIISVPYNTTGVTPSTFFGSPVSAIYLWQPSGATPESSNSVLGYYTTVNTITPGNGYFVQAANKSTILVYSGTPGPASATVTLNPGWTMIANPQLTNMTNIGANWLIDGSLLSNAITSNLIGGGVYWWNGTTYNSWTIMGDNPQIEPWKGYWIVNIDSSPHTLTIQ